MLKWKRFIAVRTRVTGVRFPSNEVFFAAAKRDGRRLGRQAKSA
jgi:hypothetical protein